MHHSDRTDALHSSRHLANPRIRKGNKIAKFVLLLEKGSAYGCIHIISTSGRGYRKGFKRNTRIESEAVQILTSCGKREREKFQFVKLRLKF